MAPPKTVVLIHGAWHGGWCYDLVVEQLHRRGVPCVAPDMPGHGADRLPLGDLAADAARTREVIDRVSGDDGVVLVGHSYGGAIIGEAASAPATAARVRHLVYLCAFMPAQGQTLMDLAGRESSPSLSSLLRPSAVAGATTIDTSDAAAAKAAFYGDCADDIVGIAASHLCPQPMANMATPLSGTPWLTIPTTYVVCTQDQAIPVGVQRSMIADARVAGAADLRVVELEASHSPFYSRPAELADHLEGLARG